MLLMNNRAVPRLTYSPSSTPLLTKVPRISAKTGRSNANRKLRDWKRRTKNSGGCSPSIPLPSRKRGSPWTWIEKRAGDSRPCVWTQCGSGASRLPVVLDSVPGTLTMSSNSQTGQVGSPTLHHLNLNKYRPGTDPPCNAQWTYQTACVSSSHGDRPCLHGMPFLRHQLALVRVVISPHRHGLSNRCWIGHGRKVDPL